MKKSVLLVLTVGLSISAHAADWAKYQSPNFTVYSDQSESRIVEMIEDLEAFRTIAMVQLGLPAASTENQNLAIVSFASNRDFKRIAQDRNVAGFYTNTNDGPRMVMGGGRRETTSAQEILFHEYTHHLTFEHSSGFTYPRWYLEGIAYVFGAAKVDKETIVLGGRPSIAEVLDYYDPLRLDTLLQNSRRGDFSTEQEVQFSATAWLMTHYLQIHALANDRELGLKNREYLTRYHRGEDPVVAFEDVFGTSLSDFQDVLNAYAKQRRIPVINWPRPALDSKVSRSAIDDTEKNYVLADLLFDGGQEALALEYLSDLNPQEDFFAEAVSLRAVMLNHDAANTDVVADLVNQLAESGVASSLVYGNLAHIELDSYRHAVEAGRSDLADALLQQAEDYARQGIAADARGFNALWYLSTVLLVRQQYDAALSVLDQAWDVFPAHQGMRLEVAKILLRQGNLAEAEPVIRSLVGASHRPELSRLLGEVLEQLKAGRIDPALLDQL